MSKFCRLKHFETKYYSTVICRRSILPVQSARLLNRVDCIFLGIPVIKCERTNIKDEFYGV
jgi:hypothetical protein